MSLLLIFHLAFSERDTELARGVWGWHIQRLDVSAYPHKRDAAAAAGKALYPLCCQYASMLVWKDHLHGKEAKVPPKPIQISPAKIITKVLMSANCGDSF